MKTKQLVSAVAAGLLLACGQVETPIAEKEATPEESRMPEWIKHANLYEVNIRQYTEEGTINAFREHMPRLADMGVKILWFMPIQPIGVENRKGPLGSYYSIQNYTTVNPEFGTLDDFKALIAEAKALDMYVILDWVANHTSFDHVWAKRHPEWYVQDSLGNILAPNPDWSDVADLNYDHSDMRQAMIDDMLFWVNEVGVDGFRCDVAFEVPTDFWETAIVALENAKPDIFMLAEADHPEHQLLERAFHADYAWDLHHIMNHVAAGEKPVSAFEDYRSRLDSLYGNDIVKMAFTSNHDENSWNGTEFERMGDAHKAYFVLATTWTRTIPLIYSGQEAGLNKRLRFFDKDTISWDTLPYEAFYRDMLHLKTTHPALANGTWGGAFELLGVDDATNVYAYARTKDESTVVVVLNFGAMAIEWAPEAYGILPNDVLYYGDLIQGKLEAVAAVIFTRKA